MSHTGKQEIGVSAMRQHEDYYFRDGNICLVVENTVFRLHRHFIERESEYFRIRLGPSSGGADGSPSSPYVIPDVTSDEFAQFIWVWYNPRYSFSDQGKEKWLTILRLATKWEFGEIRKLAIRHLEMFKLDPIEKITTYKEYSVDSYLLLPSYVALSTSKEIPSIREAEALGMDIVLKLATARERLLLCASNIPTALVSHLPEDDVKAIVAESFELTLHSTVRMEGQSNDNVPSGSPVDVRDVSPKQDKKHKPNGSTSQEVPKPWPNAPGGSGSNKVTGKQRG